MRWLVAAAIVAVVAWFVWDREFSREARIERAYASCMRQFGESAAPKAAAPAASPAVPPGTLADSLGQAMQDLVKGVTAGMSAAVCGGVRDACRSDFDGAVCRNALAGFR
jgi:hypothetical protein